MLRKLSNNSYRTNTGGVVYTGKTNPTSYGLSLQKQGCLFALVLGGVAVGVAYWVSTLI